MVDRKYVFMRARVCVSHVSAYQPVLVCSYSRNLPTRQNTPPISLPGSKKLYVLGSIRSIKIILGRALAWTHTQKIIIKAKKRKSQKNIYTVGLFQYWSSQGCIRRRLQTAAEWV